MTEFEDKRRNTHPDIPLPESKIDAMLRRIRENKAKKDKQQVKLC